ncbi:MAG: DNA adenine methylase [Desulfovibrionaceae bacterium]
MMKSPLSGYLGGKSRLVRDILARIPEHTCYCEPFAGAAWPLFAKEPSRVEVINDINGELVNLYRIVQCHLEEFVRQFKWILTAREEFERQQRTRPDTLTDIQRAASFYYRLKCSFGGKVVGQVFGTSATTPPRLNLLRIEEELSGAHLRLTRVLIEHRPYAQVIGQYDRPETFFYLDPPYLGTENAYGKGVFCRDDFTALAAQLEGIKGRFLLSLNDTSDVREVFRAFRIEAVRTRYTCGRDNDRQAGEVFISNYN